MLAGCLYPYFPTADAGADQVVPRRKSVNLKGNGTDVDGKVGSYPWTQVCGPKVKFSDAKTKNAQIHGAGRRLADRPRVRARGQRQLRRAQRAGHGHGDGRSDQVLRHRPGGPEDYEHLLTYFDQLTPENAGKWGSVEGTRDVMNWTDLDTAYQTSQATTACPSSSIP